jgi:hypothetical protein
VSPSHALAIAAAISRREGGISDQQLQVRGEALAGGTVVLSSATTGRPTARASATSGAIRIVA